MDKASVKAKAKKSLLDDIRSTTGYAVKQLKLALAILGILAWEPAPGKKTPTIMSGMAVKGFPEITGKSGVVVQTSTTYNLFTLKIPRLGSELLKKLGFDGDNTFFPYCGLSYDVRFPEGYRPKDGEDMFTQFIACAKPMLEKKLAVAETEETISNSEALETGLTKITDEMVDLFDQFIEKDSPDNRDRIHPSRRNLIQFFNRISKDILNEVLREKHWD